MYNARQVYLNYRIYQHFLRDNNLPDDSDEITVKDLMNFCENHIDKEQYEIYVEFCKEAY